MQQHDKKMWAIFKYIDYVSYQSQNLFKETIQTTKSALSTIDAVTQSLENSSEMVQLTLKPLTTAYSMLEFTVGGLEQIKEALNGVLIEIKNQLDQIPENQISAKIVEYAQAFAVLSIGFTNYTDLYTVNTQRFKKIKEEYLKTSKTLNKFKNANESTKESTFQSFYGIFREYFGNYKKDVEKMLINGKCIFETFMKKLNLLPQFIDEYYSIVMGQKQRKN